MCVLDCVQVDHEMAELEDKKKALREELDRVDKEGAAVQRAVDDLIKERDILRTTMTKAVDRTATVETLIRVQHGSQRTLENEILGARKTVKELRDTIETLLSDREKMEADFAAANQKYFTVLEQVRPWTTRGLWWQGREHPFNKYNCLVTRRSSCKTCKSRPCNARPTKRSPS